MMQWFVLLWNSIPTQNWFQGVFRRRRRWRWRRYRQSFDRSHSHYCCFSKIDQSNRISIISTWKFPIHPSDFNIIVQIDDDHHHDHDLVTADESPPLLLLLSCDIADLVYSIQTKYYSDDVRINLQDLSCTTILHIKNSFQHNVIVKPDRFLPSLCACYLHRSSCLVCVCMPDADEDDDEVDRRLSRAKTRIWKCDVGIRVLRNALLRQDGFVD